MVSMQTWIQHLTPAIIADCPKEIMDTARIGAGMMELWGTNSARKYLSVDGKCSYRLSFDVVARMILFRATTERVLSNFQRVGIEKVSILGAGDGRSCPACLEVSDAVFDLHEAPEIPLPGCTCDSGCRCCLIAEA